MTILTDIRAMRALAVPWSRVLVTMARKYLGIWYEKKKGRR